MAFNSLARSVLVASILLSSGLVFRHVDVFDDAGVPAHNKSTFNLLNASVKDLFFLLTPAEHLQALALQLDVTQVLS